VLHLPPVRGSVYAKAVLAQESTQQVSDLPVVIGFWEETQKNGGG
jgi:hypothetical protein